jgi:hypothetical protein
MRLIADPAEPTLLMIAQRRVGLRKSLQVMTYMVSWRICADDLAHEPTAEEYADWWKVSRRTAYREQALFREAFPGESSPARLLEATAHAWASRPSGRPSPAVLGASVPAL